VQACMCVGGCEYACIGVYVGEGIVTLWYSGSYERRAVPLLQLSRSNCLDTSDLRRYKKLECYAQTCVAAGVRGRVYAFRCARAVVLLCNNPTPLYYTSQISRRGISHCPSKSYTQILKAKL